MEVSVSYGLKTAKDLKDSINHLLEKEKKLHGSEILNDRFTADFTPCKRKLVIACVLDEDTGIDHYHANTQVNSSCTGDMGRCGCIHAEMMLLIKGYLKDLSNKWILTSIIPCPTCAATICALIVNYRYPLNKKSFNGVLYIEDSERYSKSKEIFAYSNVPLIQL